MIVIDTNVVAALFLPTPRSREAERAHEKDSEWAAPPLWRSEFRNLLAVQVRAGRLDLAGAEERITVAEDLIGPHELDVLSAPVLRLAAASRCTAYDCEFAALAELLDVALVTVDQELLRAFPARAVSLQDFAHHRP